MAIDQPLKKGHRHFYQPDHSVDDMKVQILEKVYHSSENPTLLTSIRRTRELFWIKELGTAKAYGFNDQIKGSLPWTTSHARRQTSMVSLINNRDEKDHGGKGTTIEALLGQMLL